MKCMDNQVMFRFFTIHIHVPILSKDPLLAPLSQSQWLMTRLALIRYIVKALSGPISSSVTWSSTGSKGVRTLKQGGCLFE